MSPNYAKNSMLTPYSIIPHSNQSVDFKMWIRSCHFPALKPPVVFHHTEIINQNHFSGLEVPTGTGLPTSVAHTSSWFLNQ